jgi:hypothetical protein
MHLLLIILRFLTGLVLGDLRVARIGGYAKPVDGLGLFAQLRLARQDRPGVVRMNVRLGPKRFGIPPDGYQVVRAAIARGGRRRLTGYGPDTTNRFCAASRERSVSI